MKHLIIVALLVSLSTLTYGQQTGLSPQDRQVHIANANAKEAAEQRFFATEVHEKCEKENEELRAVIEKQKRIIEELKKE